RRPASAPRPGAEASAPPPPASAAGWRPPAPRAWPAARAGSTRTSFDLRAHARDPGGELAQRRLRVPVHRQETGGAEEALQGLPRVGIVARLQQHLAQALANARVEIAAHHLERTRVRLAARDH